MTLHHFTLNSLSKSKIHLMHIFGSCKDTEGKKSLVVSWFPKRTKNLGQK